MLLCVFGCIVEAKLTIIVNKKIDENQMGEYERPAIQRWIKRVEGSNSKKIKLIFTPPCIIKLTFTIIKKNISLKIYKKYTNSKKIEDYLCKLPFTYTIREMIFFLIQFNSSIKIYMNNSTSSNAYYYLIQLNNRGLCFLFLFLSIISERKNKQNLHFKA